MKILTINEIDNLKDKKLITAVIPSRDILNHYNTVDDLKNAELITVTDSSESIEDVIYDFSKKYFAFEVEADGIICIDSVDDDSHIQTTSYSKDNGDTWVALNTITPYTYSAEDPSCELITISRYSIPVCAGDTVLLKSNGFGEQTKSTSYRPGGISINGGDSVKYRVSGNIMSLLYGDDFEDHTELPDVNYLTRLFGDFLQDDSYYYDNISLTSAKNLILPSLNLKISCYEGMFNGCASLTEAPELPATTLADDCYQYMFSRCTSLTQAPELPATTLVGNCYNYMFNGCTSLTQAPDLPATTLASYCYNYMFNGCTSITQAPELPATTLANSCYANMFRDCTLLNYVKCLATDISVYGSLNNWLSNVSPTGTFVKPSGTNYPTGVNGIPSGWEVENI